MTKVIIIISSRGVFQALYFESFFFESARHLAMVGGLKKSDFQFSRELVEVI